MKRRGEALLLLTADPIEMDNLRVKLKDKGVPNLWIPKRASLSKKFVLASGKLDLVKCGILAAAANPANPSQLRNR